MYDNDLKEGIWEIFDENRKLQFKGTYINGEKEGFWIDYEIDGQLKREG